MGNTARFKTDLAEIQKVQASYPVLKYQWYGVGHSLGGAIIDEVIERGLLREGLSYNPAVAAKNFNSSVPNERHYLNGDPLYALMGQHTRGSKVRSFVFVRVYKGEKPNATECLAFLKELRAKHPISFLGTDAGIEYTNNLVKNCTTTGEHSLFHMD